MTLKFYRTGAIGDLEGGLSPYTCKLELWLKLAKIPYEPITILAAEGLQKGPRGLFPWIELDGQEMGDSGLIIDHLTKLHDDPLNDRRLTEDQVVIGELVKSMCEYDLFYILAHGRFGDDRSDYESLCKFNLGIPPEQDADPEMIKAMRGFVLEKLDAWRIGRYDQDYVIKELRRCLSTLSKALGDKPYLLGDQPSAYDATLFGVLTNIIHYPFRNAQVAVSREYTNLVEYCDRIRTAYFGYEPS